MQCSHIFLAFLIFWSSFPETTAICDWIGCKRDCNSDEINNNIYNVQQRTEEAKSSTDRAISELNGLKSSTQNALSGQNSKIDSIKSDIAGLRNELKDMAALKRRLDSIEKSMKEIKKEHVNIQKTLNTTLQSNEAELLKSQNLLKTNLHDIEQLENMTSETLGIGRNNSRKLDGLKELNQLIKESVLDKVWKTDDVMAIVIPLLIVIVMLIGIIIFLLKTMFYSTKRYPKRPTKGNKNIPGQHIPDERLSSVSSASEIDSDFENDPQVNIEGAIKSPDVEHHTAGQNCRRDEWSFNPAYFFRGSGGSIRSKVSHVYDTIRSIGSSRSSTISNKMSNVYDYIRSSFRRSPTKPYLQNAKDATEAQGLLDSDCEEKTEKDNPAFEEDLNDSDYPQAKMTQITVYDTENTKEEQIQKSCQDAPYNFTPFKMYNETTQNSYPNTDPYDKTGEHSEDCRSASKTTTADSPEEGWQQVSWKDYGNSPSTSVTLAGPSKTRDDDDHSLIIAEKSSETDTPSDKCGNEINERMRTEVNSGDECPSAPENWFSVQYKDYSDTEMNSVVSAIDDNRVDGSLGTMHGSNTSALPTIPAPSDETSFEDTVSVNQHESIDDVEKSDHFSAHGNETDDIILMNTEPAKGKTTKDEEEGGNNTQLSKSLIGGAVNNKLPTNNSTTVCLDFTNFTESRSAEFKNKWQLEDELGFTPTKTEEFAEIFKPQDSYDILITMEEENNELLDNDSPNESKEPFFSGPSFETGASLRQPSRFSSVDNEHDSSAADVAGLSAFPKHQEKKLDQLDDKHTSHLSLTMTEAPEKSSVTIADKKGQDGVDGKVNDLDNSLGSSDAHYEKLKKLDQNPPYAELFPPNMQDILKEMSDSAENILNFSRGEMERSEPDDDYTGDGYDDDISGYV